MINKNELIIIAGPTAVGKSKTSIELAKKVGGEIISADSMQVYKYMNIGTAKLSKAEMEGVPHYLIDELEPTEDFNVVSFKTMADEAIKKIYESGHIPILVGGTGFYIQSVLYDIDFDNEAYDIKLRNQLEKLMKEKGEEYMHELLSELDKESASIIPKENKKRVIRAIEFFKLTGKKISEHNKLQRKKDSPYKHFFFVLNDDRAALYNRIDKRVDDMIKDGLESEVKALLELGLNESMTAMQGIGYRQMVKYLQGEYSLDDAIEKIKADTRHFAKRQLTWFKREKDAIWYNINEFNYDLLAVADNMYKYIKENHE